MSGDSGTVGEPQKRKVHSRLFGASRVDSVGADSSPSSSGLDGGSQASMVMEEDVHGVRGEVASADRMEKFRLIAQSTSDFIALATFDANPVFTYVSPSHEKFLGYEVGELLGKSPLSFIHEEDRERLLMTLVEYVRAKNEGALTEAMRENPPKLFFRFQDKHGEWHFFQSTCNIVKDELLFISKDITQEHQMQGKLRENEKRLSAIIQGLSIPAFFLDKDHKIVYWNKALEELSRVRAEDIIGTKNQWKAFYSEKRPVLADLIIDGSSKDLNDWYAGKIEKSKLLDQSYEAIDLFPRFGTNGKWLRFTAAAIRNTNGELIGALETLEDITDRKKAEIALQESEKNYRLLFESAGDAIVLMDMTGKIINANDKLLRLGGMSKEELIGKHFKDLKLFPLKDLPRIMAHFASIVAGKGKPTTITMQNKKGEWKHLEASSSIISRDGKKLGILSIIHDITDRAQAEENLQKSEEKYRLVVENAMEMIIVTQDSVIKFANQSTLNLLGYTQEELHSKPFIEFIQTDDRQMVNERYTARSKGVTSNPIYSFKIVTKQEKVRWVEIQTVNISWQGKPALLHFLRDITDQKQTLKELKASETKYRNLYDTLRDGSAVVDTQGRITECNAAFENLVGYSINELQKMTFKEITPKKWNAIENRILNQITERGYTDLYEKEYRRKDGKIIPVELQVYALYDNEHHSTGYWAFVRDITRRKKMESEQKENEERIRAIVKNAPIGIAVIDAAKNITDANTAFCNILAYPEVELLKMNFMDIIYTEDFQELMSRMADLENGRLAFIQQEKRFIKKDGSQIIGKIVINALRDQNNHPSIFIAELEDVTDRKHLYDAIKTSEEKFVKAFKVSPMAISITRLKDGKFIEINEAFEKYFGYKRKELFEQTTIQKGLWFDTKDRDFIVAELLKKGSVVNQELRFNTNGGIVKIARCSAELMDINNEQCFLSVLIDITEQKKTEEAVQQSEKKYREFVNFLPQIVFEADSQGTISLVNQTAYKLTGYTEDDIKKGVNIFQVIAACDHERVRSNLIKLAQTGYMTGNEYLLQRKDGTTFPAIIHTALATHENASAGIRGFAVDISERKQMEKQISDALDFNRKIIETSPIGKLIYDSEGQCVSANEAAAKATGGTVEELLTQNFHHLESWKKSGMYETALKALSQGVQENLETKVATTFGKEVWFNLVFSPFTSEGKQHLLVHVIDISAKKKAELTVQYERDLSKKYLSLVGTMIIGINMDQKVILVNNKGCEILGWNEEEIIGKNWFDTFIPEHFRTGIRQMFQKIIAGEIIPYEHVEGNRIVTKNGEERVIAWNNTLIRDEAGNIIATLSAGEDITERKKLEEQLIESEQRYRQQFDNASDAIFLADPETGLILDCNKAATMLLGMEKSTIVGRSQRSMHPDTDNTTSLTDDFKLHATGFSMTPIDKQVVTNSGELKDVIINASIVDYKGKKVLQGIFHDITERKMAEKDLLFINSVLKAQYETTPDALLVVSLDGKILSFNNRFIDTWKIPTDIIQTNDDKKMIENILPQIKNSEGFMERIQHLNSHHNEKSYDLIEITDGRIIERYSYPLVDANKDFLGRIWCFRDITDRKRAELQLKNKLEELERYKKVTVDRELKMMELKNEINILRKK
jgi:PAS domain S-box-containing protein